MSSRQTMAASRQTCGQATRVFVVMCFEGWVAHVRVCVHRMCWQLACIRQGCYPVRGSLQLYNTQVL